MQLKENQWNWWLDGKKIIPTAWFLHNFNSLQCFNSKLHVT